MVPNGNNMKSVRSPLLEAEQHPAQMEGRYRGLREAAPDAMVVDAFEALVKSVNDFWLTKVKLPQQTRSGRA